MIYLAAFAVGVGIVNGGGLVCHRGWRGCFLWAARLFALAACFGKYSVMMISKLKFTPCSFKIELATGLLAGRRAAPRGSTYDAQRSKPQLCFSVAVSHVGWCLTSHSHTLKHPKWTPQYVLRPSGRWFRAANPTMLSFILRSFCMRSRSFDWWVPLFHSYIKVSIFGRCLSKRTRWQLRFMWC
jgi:hypothetical protein